MGSSAIAQVSTKVIEIGATKEGDRFIHCWKNRFAPPTFDDLMIKLDGMRIHSALTLPKDINEMTNKLLNR
jgi:hypothetical protein